MGTHDRSCSTLVKLLSCQHFEPRRQLAHTQLRTYVPVSCFSFGRCTPLQVVIALPLGQRFIAFTVPLLPSTHNTPYFTSALQLTVYINNDYDPIILLLYYDVWYNLSWGARACTRHITPTLRTPHHTPHTSHAAWAIYLSVCAETYRKFQQQISLERWSFQSLLITENNSTIILV